MSHLDPVFPLPVIAALAAAAAVFTLFRAFRGRPLRPGWLQIPATLLRLAVIALLALILLNPSEKLTQTSPESASLLLLDRSASMKLATGGETTRWTDALDWADQVRQAATPPPAVAVFDEELRSLSAPSTLADTEPEGGGTRLAAALGALLQRGEETPRQIVVVSDGRTQDRGDLPETLAAARDLGVRISTKLVGTDTPPRNAWIAAVQAPRSVRPKAKVAVHVDVSSTGISPYETMALILRDEAGKEVTRTALRPHAIDDPSPVEKTLTFDIGLRSTRYSLELTPAPGEVATDDNRFTFTVEVSSSKLRVLFAEGTHAKRSVGLTGHWWNEMEFMTRAWEATGEIEYECLTTISQYNNSPNLVGVTFGNGEMRLDPSRSFPATREELHRFDVLFISDISVGNFSEDQMQWVVDWVNERGGGFLMGGGHTTFDAGHYDQTPWERIIPVDMLAHGAGFMGHAFPFTIPESVRKHPLWRVSDDPEENENILDAHPGFRGMNRIKRAKPGAIVLAVRSDTDDSEPVISAQSYGRGRSIAWQPDPNGSWGSQFMEWGPPGGPFLGPRTELGHGAELSLSEYAAKSATGPPPSHPSPWYGQYWVNVVKWLGENSVRWHRDKLAGRAKAAAAKPGEALPVAAEVLTVTRPDELLTLDVGARLDLPGTPRVRLEYDRDAREFTGELPIPASVQGAEVTVFFDVTAHGSGHTDAVPVGIRRSHLEFTETAPDHAFMNELATAAAGKVLDRPEDAAAWLAEVSEERRRQAAVTWNQPLWPRWPLLGAILALLGLEWALRRRSVLPATAALAFFLVPGTTRADETPGIDALIEQLGAPKVRLRDEAEARLREIPTAIPALKEAAASSPSMEARLRAAAVLGSITRDRWTQDLALEGHDPTPNARLHALLVDGSGRRLFTRSQDCIRQWDLDALEPSPARRTDRFPVIEAGDLDTIEPSPARKGRPLSSSTNWTADYPLLTLALSPDGKTLISTNSSGNLILNDLQNSGERLVNISTISEQTFNLPDGTTVTGQVQEDSPVAFVGFVPDGKQLMTSAIDRHVKFWSYPEIEQLSSFQLPHIGHAFALAPNKRHLVISLDRDGEPDFIHVRDLESGGNISEITIPDRANTLRLSNDGSRLLASNRNGAVMLWTLRNGALSDERILTRMAKATTCAIFSPDEKSIFVASADTNTCVSEWDPETGEALWVHPPANFSVHTIAILPDGRLAGTCSDLKLRIWSRR